MKVTFNCAISQSVNLLLNPEHGMPENLIFRQMLATYRLYGLGFFGWYTARLRVYFFRYAHNRDLPHPGIFGEHNTGFRWLCGEAGMGITGEWMGKNQNYWPMPLQLWADSCNPDFSQSVRKIVVACGRGYFPLDFVLTTMAGWLATHIQLLADGWCVMSFRCTHQLGLKPVVVAVLNLVGAVIRRVSGKALLTFWEKLKVCCLLFTLVGR